jgi:hypothetical protein
MDPVTMIVAALAAGVGAGAKDTASQAVKDAYGGLKTMLAERFRGNQSAELVLQQHEDSPQTWEVPLTGYVREAGVDKAMLALARQLLQAVQPAGVTNTVNADTIQGLVQGNHGNQTNTFGG